MALGAARRQIHGHVLGQLVPVLAAGMAIGIGLTLALGRLTAGLVFGVRAQDPGLIALSVGILIATAGLAAFIPARRATSVNPVIALRQQ
jgi:putative ABC transport system permease protein